MKTKMMIVFLALVSLNSFAQDDKKMDQQMVMFKDEKLGSAYESYLNLKDALVASNADESKKAANDLQKKLAALSNGKKGSDEAGKIATATSLKDQRLAFSNLSNEVAALVKGGKLSMGAIFLEYCPMANSNTGALWLSNEKQIKNPYFGDMMLSCGSVKETIQ